MGLVCVHHIQLMVGAQLLCSGRLELGGQSGRGAEGERRCSRRVNVAPEKGWDWVSADETGCSAPTERSPGINPLSLPPPPPPPLLPLSSLPGPPHCLQWAQQAQGGG